MKATIHHNQEIIQIDTEGKEITPDELIVVCLEKVNEYYKGHRNKIIINNETIELKIKIEK